MILIFGGAYQGKTDFVKNKFNIDDQQIFTCRNSGQIEFQKKVINSIQLYIQGAVNRDEDPISYILDNMKNMQDKIIVCDDISCGIVPLGREMRLYRDQTGKVMQILARNADEVYRVFCGLGEKIK